MKTNIAIFYVICLLSSVAFVSVSLALLAPKTPPRLELECLNRGGVIIEAGTPRAKWCVWGSRVSPE